MRVQNQVDIIADREAQGFRAPDRLDDRPLRIQVRERFFIEGRERTVAERGVDRLSPAEGLRPAPFAVSAAR